MKYLAPVTRLNRVPFLMLLMLLSLLPWLRGGEVTWQYYIVEMVVFLMMGLCLLKAAITAQNHLEFTKLRRLYIPIFILILWLLFSFLQAVPLPIKWVEVLNPAAVDVSNIKDFIALYSQQSATALLQNDNFATLSIAPHITLVEAIKYTSYVAFFIITLVLLNSPRRIYILAATLFITSLSMALYAIGNYYTKGGVFYLHPLPPWQGSNHDTITGALSYKNHYASFLNLTIPLGIGLAFYETSKTKNHLRKLTKLIDFVLSVRMFFLLSSLFMFALLIFNTSRAGMAAFLISLALTFSYLVLIKKIRIRLKSMIICCLMTLVLLIAVVATGLSDRLMHRVGNYGENGRDLLRNTAAVIIKEHPIVGTGAGTYPTIQASYKSDLLNENKMWQHVHNDYLELISTQGIFGFMTFASAMLILLFMLLQGLQGRRRQLYSLQVASLCSCLAILIHSMADFNFQLPVNTVYFWTILAMGIKVTMLNKQSFKNQRN